MKYILTILLTACLATPVTAMEPFRKADTPSILDSKYFEFLKPDGKKEFTPYHCVSQIIGVEFACNPKWSLRTENKDFIVTISENPLVTMNIQEHNQSVRFTSEISQAALESMARYNPNFRTDRMNLCDREIVKVSGNLLQDVKIVVEDYYFIDHQKLHSIQFTVASSQAYSEYEWIIRDIIESFNFIVHTGKISISEINADSCADIVEEGPSK